jgi:predicted O-methyltransferase YrrM
LENSGTVVGPDGVERDLSPVAIGPLEAAALRTWVESVRPERTLEVGLGFAVSTLSICEAVLAIGNDFDHVACDPYQLVGLPDHDTTYAGVGLAILEEAGVRERVEFLEEESQTALPRLLSEGRSFDFAFVDGNHRFEGVFIDLIFAGRLLRDDGVIFVDDTQLPSVRVAVAFCESNLGWVVEDSGREGDDHEWLVVRKGSGDALRRPFRSHVPFGIG